MAAPRGRSRLCAALLAAAVPACVIGPASDPGCHKDGDCDLGFVCRAGACFRVTTSESPPNDPADAGDSGLSD